MKMFTKREFMRSVTFKICTVSILFAGLTASAQKNNFVVDHSNPLKNFAVASNKESHPFFIDIDGDGDLDCFSGEFTNGTARMYFYKNEGSSKNAQFKQINGSGNPLSKVVTNALSIPYFIDIDGDGDYDCFIGEGNTGAIVFYKNTGTAKNPQFEKQSAANNPLSMVKFLASGVASPAFADLDGDGDYDCLITDEDGKEIFMKNTGTNKNPVFVHLTGTEDPFNDLAQNTAFFNVSFHDWNHDGLPDLFINTTYYKNIGTATKPSFIAVSDDKPNFQTKIAAYTFTPLRWVDLRSDGSAQVVTGTTKGSYVYQTISSSNMADAVTTSPAVHVFPNPSKEEFIVTLPNVNAETVIRLTDLQGKLLTTQMVNGSSFKFGKDLKPGAYFIQVMQSNKVIYSQKIIKG